MSDHARERYLDHMDEMYREIVGEREAAIHEKKLALGILRATRNPRVRDAAYDMLHEAQRTLKEMEANTD